MTQLSLYIAGLVTVCAAQYFQSGMLWFASLLFLFPAFIGAIIKALEPLK